MMAPAMMTVMAAMVSAPAEGEPERRTIGIRSAVVPIVVVPIVVIVRVSPHPPAMPLSAMPIAAADPGDTVHAILLPGVRVTQAAEGGSLG